MLGWWRRKPKRPQSDAEILSGALADLQKSETRKSRRRARRARMRLFSWMDRRILTGLVIILIAVIADGVRRENQEFFAVVSEVQGIARLYADRQSAGRPVQVGDRLADRDIVRTEARAHAVLQFPDGSVVTIGPSSQMVVKLLEYNRGGAWRARSFYLQFGQLWARVSPHFGDRSEMLIYTPSSVAAVRGTTFSVYQAHEAPTSDVMCSQGRVEVQGFRGLPQALGANSAATVPLGLPSHLPRGMSGEQVATFRQAPLLRPIEPPHWLKTFELAVTQTLDLPLTLLGIGKASPYVGSANYARRTAALEALRRLHLLLEGNASFPAYINPATIEELDIPPEEARKILSNLHGESIELYRALDGGSSFVLFARAKDPRRSLFKLTPYGPEQATAEELRQYRAY